jgi:hypothetical protein
MSEVSLNLIRVYCPVLSLVQIRKCFLDTFPLHLELLKNSLHEVGIDELVGHHLYSFRSQSLLLFHAMFVLRVPHRVMPEVEAFTGFDSSAHPLAEVFEVYLP